MANDICIEAEQVGDDGARVTLTDKPGDEATVSIVVDSENLLRPSDLTPDQHKMLDRLDKCVRENMEAVDSGYLPGEELGPLMYGDGYGTTETAPFAERDEPKPDIRRTDVDLPGFGSVSFMQVAYHNPTNCELEPGVPDPMNEPPETTSAYYAIVRTDSMREDIGIMAEGRYTPIDLDVDTTHADPVFEIVEDRTKPTTKNSKRDGR